jgi:hypothetical protein
VLPGTSKPGGFGAELDWGRIYKDFSGGLEKKVERRPVVARDLSATETKAN